MDCGPSCLRMVVKFYGNSYTLQALRLNAFISKAGVSMLGISDAAESIGFRTRGSWLPNQYEVDEIRYFKDVFSGKEEITVNSF